MTPDDLARRLDLPPDRALCLLRAAASQERHGVAQVVVQEGVVGHHRGDRGVAEQRRPEVAVGDAVVAPYGALMGASQALVARDILDAYPLGRHAHLRATRACEAPISAP
jgi:demethylspheroidene O-methyltransferase